MTQGWRVFVLIAAVAAFAAPAAAQTHTGTLEPGDATVSAVNVSQRLVDVVDDRDAELELTPIGATTGGLVNCSAVRSASMSGCARWLSCSSWACNASTRRIRRSGGGALLRDGMQTSLSGYRA